jgi:hypothetical protein
MSGLFSIASGIGEQENSNLTAQIATAVQAITLAPSISKLNQAYMEQIATDSLNYANDTAASVEIDDSWDPGGDPHKGRGPHMAVVAAQDNVQKDLDQNAADLHTGNVQNIIETIKSNASFLGQNLDDVFRLESPIIQLLALTSSLIMEI